MKKIIFLISIIMRLTNSFAQQVSWGETTIPCVFLTQGYVLESISGSGFTNSTSSHVTNISSSNPASLHNFDNVSVGLSYQFESSIKPAWIVNINHERKKTTLPQSFGLVLPFNKLRIGLGFSQRYNSILDFGKVEIRTIENPEGTGEYIEASKTDIVNSCATLLAYSINNLLDNNDALVLGIQFSYNYLDVKKQIYHSTIKADSYDIGLSFGLNYLVSKKFQFGLFFEKNPSFKDKIKLEGVDLHTPIDTDPSQTGNNDRINPNLKIDTFNLEGKMPDKLHFGIMYKMNSFMKLACDITQVFWCQQSEGSKNTIDISGSVITKITKQFSASVSFLSTGRLYDNEIGNIYDTNENLHGFFLLGGLNFRHKSFDLDFAYMTDTPFSGDWRKQKIVKLAIGFYL